MRVAVTQAVTYAVRKGLQSIPTRTPVTASATYVLKREHLQHILAEKLPCTKKAVCTVCGNEYGETKAHSYSSEWKQNENKHWHECACGSKTDETVHTFGEVNNGKKSCVCGYTVSDPNYKADESLPTGAIVAIVIGSVAAVGVVGFGVYFFVFRKKK